MRRLVVTVVATAALAAGGTAVAATLSAPPISGAENAVSKVTTSVTGATTALGVHVGTIGHPANAQKTCPPPPPNGGSPQPCGIDHNFPPPGGGGGGGGSSCPPKSMFPGSPPPCGKDHHSPPPPPSSGPPGPAACGPADQGGSAATGPVSGVLYQLGGSIGGPLGDAVQQIACALFTNLKL